MDFVKKNMIWIIVAGVAIMGLLILFPGGGSEYVTNLISNPEN